MNDKIQRLGRQFFNGLRPSGTLRPVPVVTELRAYEQGIDDGFFVGNATQITDDWSDEARAAYRQGYDHGVFLYTTTLEQEHVE